jgi:DNA-binding transcriptional regulator YiaG
MELSNKIKQLRTSLGFSQKKFAELLKIGQTTVAGYEVGRIKPSSDILEKMVKLAKTNKIKFDPFN